MYVALEKRGNSILGHDDDDMRNDFHKCNSLHTAATVLQLAGANKLEFSHTFLIKGNSHLFGGKWKCVTSAYDENCSLAWEQKERQPVNVGQKS